MTKKTKNISTLVPAENHVVTPVQLLNIAVHNGADIEKLQQLMDLQQQWEASEARKAYHQAVAAFKTESIEIVKNKSVSFPSKGGQTNYKHATLDHILEMTVPVLAKHGLSHSWEPSQKEGQIIVKCILTHSGGYSKYTEMVASPDESGTKNNIQRVASAITYLERYTFLSIVGLAAKDNDDDGRNAGKQQGYTDGLAEGLAYGMAIYKYKEIIEMVKDRLADNDLNAAAEYLYSLSTKELMSINRAPTKGGIFSVEEKAKMNGDRSKEWREARKVGFELNPDVERSM